ncbi:MAG: DUF1549 domain-containing protein, partial [Gemmataceae bacterium]|nr:DUF1549 domain-containing protein [Gemmataceae bacterium]
MLLMLLLAADYGRDVRPVLSDACFACHGPDKAKRKGGLRLDTAEGVAKAKDEIARRIASTGRDRMPPEKAARQLSGKERAALASWVAAGAKVAAHWAFVAPARPAVPEGTGANPIDRFLKAMGGAAAPETWLRRVALDLTGLPPTLAEQDAFLSDRRPDARRRVIDRLLASPRHGERMAIRWLDAARYADTSGYQNDGERIMWRWRDWVIDACNANMPFDRFTVEQLAGDLLRGATLEQRIATGFNRNHRGNAEGGIIPEEYAAEYVADRVETTSTVWLGLTMGCARCHDHKYDPLPTKDFYRMFAFFNNVPERGKAVKFGNSPPMILSPTRRQAEALEKVEDEFHAAAKESQVTGMKGWLAKPGPADKPMPPLPGELSLGAEAGRFAYTDRFSVSAFVKLKDGVIVQRADDEDEGTGWSVRLRKGRVQVNLVKRWLDDAIRVETELPLKKGSDVAVTYDGSRWASGVRVYVDGQEAKVRVLLDELNQPFDSKAAFRIGEGARDVLLFGRDLEPGEAAELATRESVAEIRKVPFAKMTFGQVLKAERYFMAHLAPKKAREADQRMRAAWRKRQQLIDRIPTTMVMEEMKTPRPAFVLKRGQYDAPGERVFPGTPAVLPAMPKDLPANRLGLARWIVSADNPLTARVAVNRLWQMLFGEGIVKTPDDFGAQGEPPSHPELLDWLAVEYRQDWDTKRLLRLIVCSDAYGRASGKGGFPRLRLPAEMVRDQALAAAGLLTQEIGGPSVKPYQPAGLWRELADLEYVRDKGDKLYRRGLYVYWKRTVPPPGLSAFDAAGREACSVRESRTNTPLQALHLLNDTAYVEAARVLAAQAMP